MEKICDNCGDVFEFDWEDNQNKNTRERKTCRECLKEEYE